MLYIMHTLAYININVYIRVEIPFYANVQQKYILVLQTTDSEKQYNIKMMIVKGQWG